VVRARLNNDNSERFGLMGIAREDGRPNPQQSRQMLRKLIDGRTIVHPREESAELEFCCALGKLIAGLHVPKAVVTPAGFDDSCTDADDLSVEVYGLVPR